MVAVTALVGAAALGLWLFSIHDRAADVDPSPILADASGSDAASDGAPTVDWEFWLSVNPDIVAWVKGVPGSLPEEMRPMARDICDSVLDASRRLLDLGIGYLGLDRAASTLSTGERQRMQLARAVRNRTTGVLYVLDEPSIGLHPLDVRVLLGVFQALLDNGATVIVIEHDLDVIRNADYVIDMGPGGGEEGGRVVACGTPAEVKRNPESRTGKFI